jgi:hypothetical protein
MRGLQTLPEEYTGAKTTKVQYIAEQHHFYAAQAPAPGKNFDAAPRLAALAHTLLYS